MSIITRMRKQKAIYWEQDGYGNDGKLKYKEAVEIKCRWDDDTERMINDAGEEFISRSYVYVDRDMKMGDYLHPSDVLAATADGAALSDFIDNGGNVSDPKANPQAAVIQTMKRNPNLRATETLITAIL